MIRCKIRYTFISKSYNHLGAYWRLSFLYSFTYIYVSAKIPLIGVPIYIKANLIWVTHETHQTYTRILNWNDLVGHLEDTIRIDLVIRYHTVQWPRFKFEAQSNPWPKIILTTLRNVYLVGVNSMESGVCCKAVTHQYIDSSITLIRVYHEDFRFYRKLIAMSRHCTLYCMCHEISPSTLIPWLVVVLVSVVWKFLGPLWLTWFNLNPSIYMSTKVW